jgi:hypothetical protein
MELFKALEKETKTKAFSKEGLILAARLDPAEKAKQEARSQLEDFVENLNRQIEQYEAEIELLQASSGGGRGKKKGKDANGANGRAEELERSNERRRWHVGNLEASMRALDNGRVTTDQVNEIKEDVAYFVESNEVSVCRMSGVIVYSPEMRRRKTLKRMKASMTTYISKKRTTMSDFWLHMTASRSRPRAAQRMICSARAVYLASRMTIHHRRRNPHR